jgi:exosortase
MPLNDHLSIASPLHDNSHPDIGGIVAKGPGEGLIQALSWPLSFSLKTRNRLSLLLVFTAVACFWKPLVALYSLSQEQEHYSHIILIPWISLYVFYLDRKAILASKDWSPALGLVLIGLGALGYWWAVSADLAADQLPMMILALVVSWWGIFLLCYGIRVCRTFSFGLLFLLFMVPFPTSLLNAIIVFLQRSSAEVTDLLFSVFGIPVFREGFVFSLSNFSIHVAEECSGIRSTLSLVIASLVAGHFFLRSSWGKMGIVAIVIPLAIIKNAFRIVGLTLLANYVDPTFITNSLVHRSGGIPLFILSLVVLFSLVWLLRMFEKRLGYYPPDGLRAKV